MVPLLLKDKHFAYNLICYSGSRARLLGEKMWLMIQKVHRHVAAGGLVGFGGQGFGSEANWHLKSQQQSCYSPLLTKWGWVYHRQFFISDSSGDAFPGGLVPPEHYWNLWIQKEDGGNSKSVPGIRSSTLLYPTHLFVFLFFSVVFFRFCSAVLVKCHFF